MADLAAIAGQAAIGAFQQTFDPHGRKAAEGQMAQDEVGRKKERHEQELQLKEQQIKQAKIKTALQEDAKKAKDLGQKFSQTNQDPNVAAEMYNSMGYDNEMQFDQAHFESTASGGRRQAAPVDSTKAGQTEDRLKPDAERQGSLVGASEGEYRFKTGTYKRDAKGQKVKGPDGKPIFIEDGEPVLFKTKQDMIDATMQTTMDPKIRTAMALKELGIDEFLQKKMIGTAATKDVDKTRHEQETERIKQSGDIQKEVATIQAKGKMAAAGMKRKSGTEGRMAVDDLRKGLVEDYNKVMHPDEDGTEKSPFTRKQTKKIMAVEENEEFKDVFKRLKALGPKKAREQNLRLQKLKKAYKLPDGYIDYLKKKLNQ